MSLPLSQYVVQVIVFQLSATCVAQEASLRVMRFYWYTRSHEQMHAGVACTHASRLRLRASHANHAALLSGGHA